MLVLLKPKYSNKRALCRRYLLAKSSLLLLFCILFGEKCGLLNKGAYYELQAPKEVGASSRADEYSFYKTTQTSKSTSHTGCSPSPRSLASLLRSTSLSWILVSDSGLTLFLSSSTIHISSVHFKYTSSFLWNLYPSENKFGIKGYCVYYKVYRKRE